MLTNGMEGGAGYRRKRRQWCGDGRGTCGGRRESGVTARRLDRLAGSCGRACRKKHGIQTHVVAAGHGQARGRRRKFSRHEEPEKGFAHRLDQHEGFGQYGRSAAGGNAAVCWTGGSELHRGWLQVTRLFLPEMVARRRGTFNTCFDGAFQAVALHFHLCATKKAFDLSLRRVMAEEMKPRDSRQCELARDSTDGEVSRCCDQEEFTAPIRSRRTRWATGFAVAGGRVL